MGLNARGVVALAQAIIYVPILCFSAVLVARHGIRRRAGWIFLVILSLVRIVGGAIHVVSEQQSNPSATLVTTFTILEGVGLSPLMLATLGFLSTIGQGVSESGRLVKVLRLLGILSTVALILTVVGGVNLGNAKTQKDVDSATNFRHIGAVLFGILYALVALTHGYLWSLKDRIMKHRRTLLAGISAVLPFLFIRTLYGVLSAFSPTSFPGSPATRNSLSKYSASTGSWEIYMAMSVIPELLTVSTYLFVGTKVPLDKDFNQAEGRGPSTEVLSGDHELRPPYQPYQQYQAYQP
ncbi:hypothetical protein EIP91_009702 [Steccherinum ochraceum]|uniref:DUF7702 domain-containing protein n=1 Tax=Steccherinum ochraceum TaxID=92696 RepID=A0A4R0RRF5_9APHY|nr:hypothetical protein EIP91_009702 [Steccherinum ochraceum]